MVENIVTHLERTVYAIKLAAFLQYEWLVSEILPHQYTAAVDGIPYQLVICTRIAGHWWCQTEMCREPRELPASRVVLGAHLDTACGCTDNASCLTHYDEGRRG